jgi:hypothetical protein
MKKNENPAEFAGLLATHSSAKGPSKTLIKVPPHPQRPEIMANQIESKGGQNHDPLFFSAFSTLLCLPHKIPRAFLDQRHIHRNRNHDIISNAGL